MGPPMVDEALDEAWRVENHELVDYALGQALFSEIGRGDGARRAQHGELPFADAFDQRNDREQLADARAVDPHQRPGGAGDLAFAVAFVEPRRQLLAVPAPMRDAQPRDRRRLPAPAR